MARETNLTRALKGDNKTQGNWGEVVLTRVLEASTAAVGRVTAQACRSSVEADRRRLGDRIGARHTHQWWARRTRFTRGEAARLLALGRSFDW